MLAKYKSKESSINDRSTTSITEDLHSTTDLNKTKKTNEEACLDLLINKGARVNEKDISGMTPIHHACLRGNYRMCSALLNISAIIPERVDHQGITPLHLACIAGHLPIVKMLMQNAVSLFCKDKDGSTPLHLASIEGSYQIVQYLTNTHR